MRKAKPRDTPCYCIRFRRAANALTKFYDRAFEPLQLTVSQFSLLNDIKLLETCNKSRLAASAGLDRTTIIRNLGTLLEKGLVEELSGDRGRLIRLTEAGHAAVAEGLGPWKQAQAQIKATIDLDGIEGFMKILEKIEALA